MTTLRLYRGSNEYTDVRNLAAANLDEIIRNWAQNRLMDPAREISFGRDSRVDSVFHYGDITGVRVMS